MKRNRIIIVTLIACSTFVYATETGTDTTISEFDQAQSWMFENRMTRYRSSQEFRPFDQVTREQAAHFFSMFSKEVLLDVIDTTKYCDFDDLYDADPTLRNSILESCLLHLFQGSAGKFHPIRGITKAEALAVLVRAIDGFRDESGAVRWENYYEQAYERGLTTVQDKSQIDVPVTRYEIALLLFRAQKISLLEDEIIGNSNE